jgi:hypothetical protein
MLRATDAPLLARLSAAYWSLDLAAFPNRSLILPLVADSVY